MSTPDPTQHQPETVAPRNDARGPQDHGGMMMHMVAQATRTQIAVVSVITTLALVVGLILSASYANLTLSARQVGGLVMPPGMIMTRATSADAMRDMAAVDPREVLIAAAP